MRELAYHTYWDLRAPHRIEGSVFAQLFENNAAQPLFPNLQVLSWQRSSADEDMSKLAQIIAPPTLSVLKLHHPMWIDYKPRFVPAYFTRDGRPEDLHIFTDACPALEHILIDLIYPSHDLCSVANCHHLRSFSVEQVHLNVLWRLAQLPNLTHIDTELCSEEPSGPPATSPVEAPLPLFSSLKTITFVNSLPSPVISFLTTISPVALTSATIRLTRARSDDIPLCLSVLCSERLAHTLRVISVSFGCTWAQRGSESERCHFLTLARPLLRVASIEVLHFSISGRALVLSDNDVTEMARSWPRIVSLSITHNPEYTEPKDRPRGAHYANLIRPSLSTLISLAEQCGSLESMKFDPADVSEQELVSLEARATPSNPRSVLSQFVPARSDAFDGLVIHDVPRLASALLRIFPNLEGKGVLAKHERRPIRSRLTDWDTETNNQADELLRRLDAMHAKGSV